MAENEIESPLDPSLEARMIAALQAVPRIEIPADFAVRLAAKLTTAELVTLRPGRFARLTGVACMVVLFFLMLLFAPRATLSSSYWFSIESVFCVQFALLAVWLATRGHTSASSF